VDARLDHRAVQEHIDVLQGLVDVLERLSLGLAVSEPIRRLMLRWGYRSLRSASNATTLVELWLSWTPT
ncbi:MAG: hypothetical protein ACKPKO_41780, partial [Candidatus Fonsibacter sp.]